MKTVPPLSASRKISINGIPLVNQGIEMQMDIIPAESRVGTHHHHNNR
jgi:hypothetical protein